MMKIAILPVFILLTSSLSFACEKPEAPPADAETKEFQYTLEEFGDIVRGEIELLQELYATDKDVFAEMAGNLETLIIDETTDSPMRRKLLRILKFLKATGSIDPKKALIAYDTRSGEPSFHGDCFKSLESETTFICLEPHELPGNEPLVLDLSGFTCTQTGNDPEDPSFSCEDLRPGKSGLVEFGPNRFDPLPTLERVLAPRRNRCG